MRNSIVRYSFLIPLAAFVLLLGSSRPAAAQNSIDGVVLDSKRRPVAEIDVELLDEYERFVRSTKTKSSGLYVFAGMRAGVYYIRVRTAGTNFREAKERVVLGGGLSGRGSQGVIPSGESVQVNLTLEVDPNKGPSGGPLVNEVVFAQSVPPDAQKSYEEALKSLEKKNQAEAVALLEAAVKIFPDYYLALSQLGSEYFAQDKFAEAAGVLKRAFEINPKSFSSAYGLGAAQYLLGQKTDAERTLTSALSLNPASVNSHFLLGKIQREQKEFKKAETSFKKANEYSDGKVPDIYWELALLYYHNLKLYEEAARALEQYLKIYPNAPNKEQVHKLIKDFRAKTRQNN